MMKGFVRILVSFCVAAALSLADWRAHAAEFADAALVEQSLDLAPFVKFVRSDSASFNYTGTPDTAGNAPAIQLQSERSTGPYYWAVVLLANTRKEPAELIIAAKQQGFAGSGLLWPKAAGVRIMKVSLSGGLPVSKIQTPATDAYGLTLGVNQGVLVAIETTENALPGLSLWSRDAFASHGIGQAFQHGAELGIALLLGVLILALYSVRRMPAFPAGFLFAAAASFFIALETGLAPQPLRLMGGLTISGSAAYALAETLMLTGLILCLVTFVELRRRRRPLGNLMLALAGVSLGLIAYAFVGPARAGGVARLAFFVVAALGLAVTFDLSRQGHTRAQVSLPVWIAIMGWTVLASCAALIPGAETAFRPLVSGALVLVLMTMAFTLAQFAFSQGFLSKRFFEESGRRALALAGAQQYVWDWQVDSEELYVGEELERALGTRPGYFAEAGLEGWYELLHPLDRPAYDAAVFNAQKRGKGAFGQEFRLRSVDAGYHWFKLSARVMPGPDSRPFRLIGTLTDITTSKRSEERLLSDAIYDRVTGLPNKALFLDRLERAMTLAIKERPGTVHVVMIDLDRFKTINDGLGHETGDALLNSIGRRLQSLAGPEDTIARFPGDQFAAMAVSKNGQRDPAAFAEKLVLAISRPFDLKPNEIFLTASAGVSAFDNRGLSAADLVRNASIALHHAKRRAKGAIQFHSAEMSDERNDLVALESSLRRSIERNEIEIHYQPIAQLRDMDLAGFEALVRWRHPERGLLQPEAFIPAAEQTGFIRDIGRHVMAQAARQLGIWQRAFRPGAPMFMAVNISSSQLMVAGLAEELKAILAREGVRPGTLKLEMTESVVMENPELAARILDKLKGMGVGLACDDFGTGYSSLSTLRRLPFDTLKIDKSFVAPGAADDRADVVLESIIALGHGLGLKVVAEGVETQAQVNRLGALGCDFGQGFFIGEPMTVKQVNAALSKMPYGPTEDQSPIGSLIDETVHTPEPEPVSADAASPSGEPEPLPTPPGIFFRRSALPPAPGQSPPAPKLPPFSAPSEAAAGEPNPVAPKKKPRKKRKSLRKARLIKGGLE